MTRKVRNILCIISGCIAFVIICISQINTTEADAYSVFDWTTFSIILGYLATIATILTLFHFFENEGVIVIQVRPTDAVQEHHNLTERLVAIDTEKSQILARKAALEAPGSDSAKILDIRSGRPQG